MYVTDDAVVVVVVLFLSHHLSLSLPLSVATTMARRVVAAAATTKMTVGHKSSPYIISIGLRIQRTHRRMA